MKLTYDRIIASPLWERKALKLVCCLAPFIQRAMPPVLPQVACACGAAALFAGVAAVLGQKPTGRRDGGYAMMAMHSSGVFLPISSKL